MTLQEVSEAFGLSDDIIVHIFRPDGRIDANLGSQEIKYLLDKRFKELYWNGSQLCITF